MRRENAYLTVCMALCLPLILSLCLTLIGGVRQNGGRLEAICVSETAVQSVLSEYHRELRNQYDIFAIDSSYGSKVSGKKNMEAHLRMYIEKNLSKEETLWDFVIRERDFFGLQAGTEEIVKILLLSDHKGKVFRSLAADVAWDESVLGLSEEIQSWINTVEINGLERGEEALQQEQVNQEISQYITEYPELEIKNPADRINQQRREGILKLVTDTDMLSDKAITGETVEYRLQQGALNQGNMPFGNGGREKLLENYFFRKFLWEKMGHFGNVLEEKALDYEWEYLIAGKTTDIENLRSIANRLVLLREAANMLYLWNAQEKRNEVLLLAEATCAALLLPELTPVMELAILLGWSYAESVYDVKCLMEGEKIPLLKRDEDWHYGLAAALNGQEESGDGQRDGLSYEEYLMMFMTMENADKLTLRAMNLVEANIRKTKGNENFRLDACCVGLDVEIVVDSVYGHRYEYKRQRYY